MDSNEYSFDVIVGQNPGEVIYRGYTYTLTGVATIRSVETTIRDIEYQAKSWVLETPWAMSHHVTDTTCPEWPLQETLTPGDWVALFDANDMDEFIWVPCCDVPVEIMDYYNKLFSCED